MRNTILLLLASFSFSLLPARAKSPPEPFSDRCLVGEPDLYPGKVSVPWFTVDLDQSAYERWKEISYKYRNEIKDLSQAIKDILKTVLGQRIVTLIDLSFAELDDRFGQPYADELRGVSNFTGVPLGEVVLFNIFYEVFTVCTSIVAQDPSGGLYHARNMDFGLFMGWNRTSHDWLATEKLRSMVVNVNFVKNGKLVYKAATFAGYIGIYNAMKPNAFAVTVNERFKLNGGYMGIVQWLLKRNRASWMSWMIREVFETTDDYDSAVLKLSSTPVIAPLYVIISGTKPGQAKIIVRSRNATDGVVDLEPSAGPDRWFLLQTNTDPWQRPFFLDDRRTPGHRCMVRLGRRNLTAPGLFQVLSSPTTLNKLTVFSILIRTDRGLFETYVQKCPDPCWPW